MFKMVEDKLSDARISRILLHIRRRRRRINAFLYYMNSMVLEYSTINSQGFWNENILNYWTNDD